MGVCAAVTMACGTVIDAAGRPPSTLTISATAAAIPAQAGSGCSYCELTLTVPSDNYGQIQWPGEVTVRIAVDTDAPL